MKERGREQTVAFGSWTLHSCSLGAIHQHGTFSWVIQLPLNQYYLFSSGQACVMCKTLGRKQLGRHSVAMSSSDAGISVNLAGHWCVQNIWATSCCRSGAAREERDQSQGLQHLLTTILISFLCGLNTSLFNSFAWSSLLSSKHKEC